jgi:hypothetical protein
MNKSALRPAKTAELSFARFSCRGKNGEKKFAENLV